MAMQLLKNITGEDTKLAYSRGGWEVSSLAMSEATSILDLRYGAEPQPLSQAKRPQHFINIYAVKPANFSQLNTRTEKPLAQTPLNSQLRSIRLMALRAYFQVETTVCATCAQGE